MMAMCINRKGMDSYIYINSGVWLLVHALTSMGVWVNHNWSYCMEEQLHSIERGLQLLVHVLISVKLSKQKGAQSWFSKVYS